MIIGLFHFTLTKKRIAELDKICDKEELHMILDYLFSNDPCLSDRIELYHYINRNIDKTYCNHLIDLEIKAEEAKYNYLIKQVKKAELKKK